MIERAVEILAARGKQRQAEAMQEIQRLAKAHGLAVDVKGPKQRRGRPRKPKGGGAGA